jgi:mannose-6-phosphate isomerase
MLYPLSFHPIFQERIWGGRNLERLFQKSLPPNRAIGESWEISDRPEAVSVIANGPLAGKDLRWLMKEHQVDLMGKSQPMGDRFPLLVKILDATDKLSLQVHPPQAVARKLHGEPKTEIWYIAQAEPGAELYVGLRHGVSRQEFEKKIESGAVAECFHRIKVQAGDIMSLPSGRVHAIGKGLVIFEVQQNSDTTYRVFDWNRLDKEGKPRPLHIPESLLSIDFQDFEPTLVQAPATGLQEIASRLLVENEQFSVSLVEGEEGADIHLTGRNHAEVIGVIKGSLQIEEAGRRLSLGPGNFSLLPACLDRLTIRFSMSGAFLLARAL